MQIAPVDNEKDFISTNMGITRDRVTGRETNKLNTIPPDLRICEEYEVKIIFFLTV